MNSYFLKRGQLGQGTKVYGSWGFGVHARELAQLE